MEKTLITNTMEKTIDEKSRQSLNVELVYKETKSEIFFEGARSVLVVVCWAYDV